MILISGGLFLAALIFTGICQRIAGADVKGRAPISSPLFLAGKAAISTGDQISLPLATGTPSSAYP